MDKLARVAGMLVALLIIAAIVLALARLVLELAFGLAGVFA